MKRFYSFLLVCLVTALAAAAAPRGQHGRPGGSMGPTAQGPHQQQGQRGPHDARGPGMAGTHEPQRPPSRLHDCQRACEKAREEARQLQRYADRTRFEPETAQQLGRQLRQHLEVMDREHGRMLGERLSATEREQHRDRLEMMTQCQQRWQEALEGVEKELAKPAPNREELRRRARTIEKEIKKYEKELHRLEETVGS